MFVSIFDMIVLINNRHLCISYISHRIFSLVRLEYLHDYEYKNIYLSYDRLSTLSTNFHQLILFIIDLKNVLDGTVLWDGFYHLCLRFTH